MGGVARRDFLTAAGAMLAAACGGCLSEAWLSINQRTAKALGLEVPSRLVLQADRVIE